MTLIMVFMFSFISQATSQSELSDFKTDFCTGFIEGPRNKPDLWKECCFEHDLRYWFGGTRTQRTQSDRRLKGCVQEKSNRYWSSLMYSGVRLGHLSPIKHETRWGWGWSDQKKYRVHDEQEVQIICSKLLNLGLNTQFYTYFIDSINLPCQKYKAN